MKRILAIPMLALVFDIAATGQQPQQVQYLLSVLAGAGVSGSLEYNGKCGPSVLVPDLPPIREPQAPDAQNPAATLRSMFSIDGRMLVSQNANGTIRVVESGIQTDILQVRIKHLSFNLISDPEEALDIALAAPEVQSFINTHGIGQPVNPLIAPLWALPGAERNTTPGPVVRSVHGELNDVTLAEVLDFILKTFPGFWLYQDCKSPAGERVIHFEFFPIPGRIWVWGRGRMWLKQPNATPPPGAAAATRQ